MELFLFPVCNREAQRFHNLPISRAWIWAQNVEASKSMFLTILWNVDINGKKFPHRKDTHLNFQVKWFWLQEVLNSIFKMDYAPSQSVNHSINQSNSLTKFERQLKALKKQNKTNKAEWKEQKRTEAITPHSKTRIPSELHPCILCLGNITQYRCSHRYVSILFLKGAAKANKQNKPQIMN